MTNLNPSHLPFLAHNNNDRTGQAVHNSVSQPKHYSHLNDYSPTPDTSSGPPAHAESEGSSSDSDEADADVEAVLNPQAAQPSWRGAFKRRMDARAAAKAARKEEERKQAKIPVPALPDLRFEQGVLLSIRPFLHRTTPKRDKKVTKSEKAEERTEAEEDGAMVGGPLTAEGAEDGDDQEDVFAGPLRIEWAQLSYVIFRDQVFYPLLQGAAWGAGSLLLGGLWAWNKQRMANQKPTSGPVRGGLLSRLGLHFR